MTKPLQMTDLRRGYCTWLLEHPGEKATVRQLAGFTSHDHNTVSASLRVLAKHGLVEKHTDEGPGNPLARYTLTDAGREWAEKGIAG